jgi:hypothetical protein
LWVIVKIPERPRNPDLSAPEGAILPVCALWIISKKRSLGAAERKGAPPSQRRKIAFGFLETKIADGAARFFSRSPRDVRDGRRSGWSEARTHVDRSRFDAGQRDALIR